MSDPQPWEQLLDRLRAWAREFYDEGMGPWQDAMEGTIALAESARSADQDEITRLRQALKNIWQMAPCECRWNFQKRERDYQCEACEVYEAALAPSSPSSPETT